MTVKELKQQLDAYPDDMIVVISGYEEGFDDIHIVEEIEACYRATAWYYGAYRNDYPIYLWETGEHINKGSLPEIKVCCLKRKNY